MFSRKRRVQRSFQGQLHTQDESDLLGSHLIFSAHIQIPPGSFCAVSTFYLKKINTSFFPWSDRGTLFVAFARSPPHLRNVKDLKPWIKGTFLINIFFFLKRFFLFKSCFSLFISVLKVLLSWFLTRGLIWSRWSLQNWLDKLGNYNVEHAVLWNVL